MKTQAKIKKPKPYLYVATKPCGCITMAAVDDGKELGNLAKVVARAIKRGDYVNRVSHRKYLSMNWNCQEHEPSIPDRIGMG